MSEVLVATVRAKIQKIKIHIELITKANLRNYLTCFHVGKNSPSYRMHSRHVLS